MYAYEVFRPGRRRVGGSNQARRFVAALALLVAVSGVGAGVFPAAPASAATSFAMSMRYTRTPYPGAGTAPDMEDAIFQTWPAELHGQALNVAWCESRGRSEARNGQHLGHFQIGRAEWRRFGVGNPYNAVDNAAAAFRYYSYAGGWRPWECQP